MRRRPRDVDLALDRREVELAGRATVVGGGDLGRALRRGGHVLARRLRHAGESPRAAHQRAHAQAVRLAGVDAGDPILARRHRLEAVTRHSNVGVPGAGAFRLVEGEQRELGVGPVLGRCRLRVRGAGRLRAPRRRRRRGRRARWRRRRRPLLAAARGGRGGVAGSSGSQWAMRSRPWSRAMTITAMAL